jgi:predicted dehydrogenase
MPEHQTGSVTRRDFVKSTAMAAAAAGAFPRFVVGAPASRPLTIGVIGCGGRGTGAALNAMDADPNVKITAAADIAEDRLNGFRGRMKDTKGLDIPDNRIFLGMDAYKKLLDTDVDYVILATPPYYRPIHFPACIAADKNVFTEKPVGVDPVGIRKFIEAGKQADKKNLKVAAGTQRRHQNSYRATIKLLHDGAIGEIVSAQCYWNGTVPFSNQRREGWSDMEWMHRDWVNWCWLSGDHIVEQHVHNLDVINWALKAHPEKVVAFGARSRRPTGDQFDHFSADFTYPGEIHVHSMCRQLSGCYNNVSERVIGQKGQSNCSGQITTGVEVKFDGNDAYVQEHKDLIEAIRAETPLNEAQNVAESTLSAIMARESAYTGRQIQWDQFYNSDLELKPPTYELTLENIRAHVPVPGKA